MNWIGFIPSGIMISSFGLSLTLLLPKNILARSGSVLLIIFGLGMTVVGFFSCDEGCPREGSLENNIHDQISGPIFLCAILGSLLLGLTFRRLPYWRKLWLYSIVSAILSFVFLINLVDSLDTYRFTGMWQRLILLTLFSWFGNIACTQVLAQQNFGLALLIGKSAANKNAYVTSGFFTQNSNNILLTWFH